MLQALRLPPRGVCAEDLRSAWLRGARAQSWLQLVVAFGVVHSPLLKASPTNYQRPFKKGIRSFLIILNEFKIQIVSPLEKLLGYARFIFTSFPRVADTLNDLLHPK